MIYKTVCGLGLHYFQNHLFQGQSNHFSNNPSNATEQENRSQELGFIYVYLCSTL